MWANLANNITQPLAVFGSKGPLKDINLVIFNWKEISLLLRNVSI